jgi:hypothetical protein
MYGVINPAILATDELIPVPTLLTLVGKTSGV